MLCMHTCVYSQLYEFLHRFGDNCEYANLPSSTCIKYMRGKCAFGDRCKEHHPQSGTGGMNGAFGMYVHTCVSTHVCVHIFDMCI